MICSGLVFCASSRMMKRVVKRAAAHEGQRRHLDHAALQVLVHLLGLEHVVEGVEERAQVGVDLRRDVAGQEAEPLAGLDRRAGEHDPVDLAARQRRHGHRHGEERLAGAGRADADRDRLAADRVDVALLVDGLGRDLAGRGGARPRPRGCGSGSRGGRARRRSPRSCPGAISWPWRTRSVISRTTVRAIATASSSPSSVSTLPRRKTSQSRCSSSVFMTASPGPASSAATSFGSSSWIALRASASPSPPRSRACRRRGPSPAASRAPMTLPISCGEEAPDSATASPTIALQLLVRELLGQVRGDHLGLALLGLGGVGAAAVAVGLGGLEAALALALEHLDRRRRRCPSRPSEARRRSGAAHARARGRPP